MMTMYVQLSIAPSPHRAVNWQQSTYHICVAY